MKKPGWIYIVILAIGLAVTPSAVTAEDQPVALERFFGTYEGVSLRPRSEVRSRDLKVVIRPFEEDGFSIDWQTTLYEPGGDDRRKTQSLTFKPQKAGVAFYVLASSELGVGLAPSGTPFEGAPFVWASIVGDVLTVNVLTIATNGDWVMQTYNRALTKDGLALSFTRVHDGEVEKRLWGALDRVEK